MNGIVFVPLAPVVRVVPFVTAVWFRPAVTPVAKFLAVPIEENRMAKPLPVTSDTTRISGTIGTTPILSTTATSASLSLSGTSHTTGKVEPSSLSQPLQLRARRRQEFAHRHGFSAAQNPENRQTPRNHDSVVPGRGQAPQNSKLAE